ncbi:hypothetical protein ACHHYP_04126 [Achlya hypogyna]|uniref:Tudor domain-containing protein n=1 Tax=Achlya hypogyna TaxID=1202772 RepID=A0A1V9Z2A7_ACHHY|nr:hypothetical protein ACHHYP_04126 [Achlya hypogyna]
MLLTEGLRVDGLYAGGDVWFPGTIAVVVDGICTIQYDDGEVEEGVPERLLRPHEPGTFSVGSRVLARYGGGDDLYPGSITAVDDVNNLYDIAYDDGETEENVFHAYLMDEPLPEFADSPRPPSPIAEVSPPPTTSEATLQPRPPQPRHPMPLLSQDDSGTHDEPFTSFLNCETEVKTLIGILGEPVGNNETLVVAKNALAQLLHQLRVAPHVTADVCRSCGGEQRLLQCIQDNLLHSILVCFCFVIVRRLCSVSELAFETFLSLDVLSTVSNVMLLCPQDAVLQASACGVLATFARGAGIERMLALHMPHLIIGVLLQHQPLNHYSRQVHYYASEVLLRLADTGDKRVLNVMSAVDSTNGSTAMHLLVILLRQGHQHEDQKVACAACTLVLCLAAKDRKCAEILRSTDALTDISTVMAKYPNDNGISMYSTVATREIALASIKNSGASKVHDKAAAILSQPSAPVPPVADLTQSASMKKLLKPPTPSKKRQAFSRNAIAPAPKLSANVNASLSKMQLMARIKSPGPPPPSTGPGVGTAPVAHLPLRASMPQESPDRLVKHHRFIPFEQKLEWRLLHATPKKTVPVPSPTARTLERESILMQTYGVPTLREMHFPPSQAAFAKEKEGVKFKPSIARTSELARAKLPPRQEVPRSGQPSPRPPPATNPPKDTKDPGKPPVVVKYKIQIDAKAREVAKPKSTAKKKVKVLNVRQQSLQKIRHEDILDQRAMNQLATQLFNEPSAANAVVVPEAKSDARDTGRLSFSDKLHQMIRTAEEALCRPPSAVDLRAATPPSLQFSEAAIPPRKLSTPTPVAPPSESVEPEPAPLPPVRRASTTELRRGSTSESRRGSFVEQRRASKCAALDLNLNSIHTDEFPTSRSDPAMVLEPQVATDRTAVSEHPMPSDTETPRFDAEIELASLLKDEADTSSTSADSAREEAPGDEARSEAVDDGDANATEAPAAAEAPAEKDELHAVDAVESDYGDDDFEDLDPGAGGDAEDEASARIETCGDDAADGNVETAPDAETALNIEAPKENDAQSYEEAAAPSTAVVEAGEVKSAPEDAGDAVVEASDAVDTSESSVPAAACGEPTMESAEGTPIPVSDNFVPMPEKARSESFVSGTTTHHNEIVSAPSDEPPAEAADAEPVAKAAIDSAVAASETPTPTLDEVVDDDIADEAAFDAVDDDVPSINESTDDTSHTPDQPLVSGEPNLGTQLVNPELQLSDEGVRGGAIASEVAVEPEKVQSNSIVKEGISDAEATITDAPSGFTPAASATTQDSVHEAGVIGITLNDGDVAPEDSTQASAVVDESDKLLDATATLNQEPAAQFAAGAVEAPSTVESSESRDCEVPADVDLAESAPVVEMLSPLEDTAAASEHVVATEPVATLEPTIKTEDVPTAPKEVAETTSDDSLARPTVAIASDLPPEIEYEEEALEDYGEVSAEIEAIAADDLTSPCTPAENSTMADQSIVGLAAADVGIEDTPAAEVRDTDTAEGPVGGSPSAAFEKQRNDSATDADETSPLEPTPRVSATDDESLEVPAGADSAHWQAVADDRVDKEEAPSPPIASAEHLERLNFDAAVATALPLSSRLEAVDTDESASLLFVEPNITEAPAPESPREVSAPSVVDELSTSTQEPEWPSSAPETTPSVETTALDLSTSQEGTASERAIGEIESDTFASPPSVSDATLPVDEELAELVGDFDKASSTASLADVVDLETAITNHEPSVAVPALSLGALHGAVVEGTEQDSDDSTRAATEGSTRSDPGQIQDYSGRSSLVSLTSARHPDAAMMPVAGEGADDDDDGSYAEEDFAEFSETDVNPTPEKPITKDEEAPPLADASSPDRELHVVKARADDLTTAEWAVDGAVDTTSDPALPQQKDELDAGTVGATQTSLLPGQTPASEETTTHDAVQEGALDQPVAQETPTSDESQAMVPLDNEDSRTDAPPSLQFPDDNAPATSAAPGPGQPVNSPVEAADAALDAPSTAPISSTRHEEAAAPTVEVSPRNNLQDPSHAVSSPPATSRAAFDVPPLTLSPTSARSEATPTPRSDVSSRVGNGSSARIPDAGTSLPADDAVPLTVAGNHCNDADDGDAKGAHDGDDDEYADDDFED